MRVRDLLEPLLRGCVIRVGVGVVPARECTVGLLDGLVVRVLGNAEDRIEILVVQWVPPPWDTTTRAGRMTASDIR
jgi:hypothetical protein